MNAFNQSELRALSRSLLADPADLSANDVLDVLLGRRYGVEYQPIIEVQSAEIAGYQAAARFWNNRQQKLDTGAMFAMLHKNPLLLFHAELEVKKLQIEESPPGGWLMLDLDIDSFYEGGEGLDNPFLSLFKQHAWSDRELIINLVENHTMADVERAQRIIELLNQSGTAVALEDVGVGWGMFSLSAFMDARVIKFNGQTLRGLNEKSAYATVDWLVSAARRIGVQTIMSGVDSCEQFEWAKRLGVDCVQGRLFGKKSFSIKP